MGEEEVRLTKECLGCPIDEVFCVPDQVIDAFKNFVKKGLDAEAVWREKFNEFTNSSPDAALELIHALEEKLPDVGQAQGTVVIFRLRDRDEVGSTFIRALDRYARTLQAAGNRLMLVGLNEKVVDQLANTDVLDLIGKENVFPGQPEFGAALRDALAAAEEWLVRDRGNSG